MKKRTLLLITAIFMLFNIGYAFTDNIDNLSKSGGNDEWISIEGGTAPNAQLPFNFTNATSVVQVIYSAEIINSEECTMKGLKYFYNNSMAEITNKSVKVYIATTTLTNLSAGWIPQSDFTLVFSGQVSLPKDGTASELNIDFDTPYLYTGGNICIMTVREMDVNTTSNVTGYNRTPSEQTARFFQSQTETFNFTQPGSAAARIPNTRIKIQGKPAVQEEWISIEGGTSSHSQFPFNFTWATSAVQTIYAADLINKGECKLTGLKYFFTNNTADVVNKNVKVYIAPTTLTNLEGGWIPQANFTLVFDGAVSLPKNGVNSELDINFTTPYLYAGGNICIMTIKDFDVNTTANVTGFNRQPVEKTARYFQSQSEVFDFTQQGSIINRMPNVRIKAEVQPAPTEFTVLISTPSNGTIEVKNGDQVINNGDAVPAGTTLTFNAIPAEGYHLVNKYVNGTIFEGTTLELTKSVQISAEFAINQYTVSWTEPENGTLTVKNGGITLTSGSSVNHNTVLTITATPNAGYELTSLTVNGNAFVSGQTLTVTENVNIESVINIKKYAISWENPKGGTISVFSGSNNIDNGDLVEHFTIITISLTASEGYLPATVTVNGMEFENNENITVTTTLTIAATTSLVSYDITYNNTNGATNANPTTYNIESTVINLQPLTLDGYTFEGWYDNADFNGTAITQIASGTTGNKQFYAKWSLVTYTITYNNVEGATNANPTSYDVETPTITLQPLSREGYTFEGWHDNAGLTGTAITQIAKGSTGNKQFYAKWTLINYTITYNNVEGATNSNPTTYNIETPTITLQPLSREGYTFEGWHDNAELTGTAITQIAKGSTGNKQFYAKWEILRFTITATAGEHGSISPSTTTVEYGQSITFTFTADEKYKLDRIIIDGETHDPVDEYVFTNVNANHTIHAVFREADGVAHLNDNNIAAFANGKVITISATDTDNYQYQIIDLGGRLINGGHFSDTTTVAVDKQGVYIVRIMAQDKVVTSIKVICK